MSSARCMVAAGPAKSYNRTYMLLRPLSGPAHYFAGANPFLRREESTVVDKM